VELKVAPLTNAHGPLTRLYVSAVLSVLVVEALTVKLPPRYVGVGAAPKVMTGVALPIVMLCVCEAAVKLIVAAPSA
jgi:hypothetical protein